MKASKLREQSNEELQSVVADLKKERAELTAKAGIGEASAPPMRRRLVRRDIARVLTIIKERESKSHG